MKLIFSCFGWRFLHALPFRPLAFPRACECESSSFDPTLYPLQVILFLTAPGQLFRDRGPPLLIRTDPFGNAGPYVLFPTGAETFPINSLPLVRGPCFCLLFMAAVLEASGVPCFVITFRVPHAVVGGAPPHANHLFLCSICFSITRLSIQLALRGLILFFVRCFRRSVPLRFRFSPPASDPQKTAPLRQMVSASRTLSTSTCP